jgi:ABC-type amino acid transport substrate-binding protein
MKTTILLRYLMSVALAVAMVLADIACAPAAQPTPTPQAAKSIIPNSELVAPGKLTIATTGSASPFTLMDKDGKLQGYDIDVCNALAEKLGLTPAWTTIEWAGTLPGLKAGRWDMVCSGVGLTPERLTSPEFAMSVPTIQGGGYIYVRGDEERFKTWDELKGKNIGCVRGAWYGNWVKANKLGGDANVVDYPGETELFMDLNNKRIDAVAFGSMGAAALKETYKVKVPLEEYNPTPYGVAIRKEARVLLKETNNAFWEFQQSGQLEKWQVKWFGVAKPVGGK